MRTRICSTCDYGPADGECARGRADPRGWCSAWTPLRRDPGSSLMAVIGVGLMVLGLIALLALWSCNR